MGLWGHSAVEGSIVGAVGREGACCCPLGVRAPGARGQEGRRGRRGEHCVLRCALSVQEPQGGPRAQRREQEAGPEWEEEGVWWGHRGGDQAWTCTPGSSRCSCRILRCDMPNLGFSSISLAPLVKAAMVGIVSIFQKRKSRLRESFSEAVRGGRWAGLGTGALRARLSWSPQSCHLM